MRAVVYCRVSTKDQVENLSLPTQEKACREYCGSLGLEVVEVFIDKGESAKTIDRPAFLRSLEFCRTGRITHFVVYSLSRFSRSTHDHAIIAARLKAYGVTLRSVTEPIDDSSTGRLMESILAGFAQFDNDVKADRTRAGMRAALERGRWTWRAPLGYLTGMAPDPERAPIVQRAFDLAATWRGTAVELREEVGRLGLTTRSGRPIPRMTMFRLLRNPLYCGTIRAPGWGLEARASFEPLIDEETFYMAQAALNGRPVRPRRRVNPDFPLRRLILCGPCGKPLTGYFARGKGGGRYGYYRCPACNGVSEPKVVIEAAFVVLLDGFGVNPACLEEIRRETLSIWERDRGQAQTMRETRERTLRALREKKSRLVDGYLARDLDADTYRAKLSEIEDAVALATVAAVDATIDEHTLQGALAFAEHCLQHPGRAWLEFSPEARQGFAGLLFSAGLPWYPKSGFRTPHLPPVFSNLRQEINENARLVAPAAPHANTLMALVCLWRAAQPHHAHA